MTYDMKIWCFTSLSTLFKSYQDNGRVIMKGSEQRGFLQSGAEFRLKRDSNPGLHEPKLEALTILAPWHFMTPINLPQPTFEDRNPTFLVLSLSMCSLDLENMHMKQYESQMQASMARISLNNHSLSVQ